MRGKEREREWEIEREGGREREGERERTVTARVTINWKVFELSLVSGETSLVGTIGRNELLAATVALSFTARARAESQPLAKKIYWVKSSIALSVAGVVRSRGHPAHIVKLYLAADWPLCFPRHGLGRGRVEGRWPARTRSKGPEIAAPIVSFENRLQTQSLLATERQRKERERERERSAAFAFPDLGTYRHWVTISVAERLSIAGRADLLAPGNRSAEPSTSYFFKVRPLSIALITAKNLNNS